MKKRRLLLSLFMTLALLLISSFSFKAEVVESKASIIPSPEIKIEEDQPVTQEAESATPSAIVERVVEKKKDITEPTSEIKDKLGSYLSDHPLKPLTITNFLQHAIRSAIKNGVPANTIVLILLFPLVAAIIAGSRHVVGVRGFGIFLPAVLSVVLVATGIIEGILLFLVIIMVATAARMALRKLKIEYLPRMSLLLWFVCLGVLLTLFLSPILNLIALTTLSIFPILILILLAENFISIHITMSMKEALRMTFETLFIALICSLVLNLEFLQKFVLLYPEITVITIAFLNLFMGKYVGLRILEYKKFKEIF